MTHFLVLTANRLGVLARIAGLVSSMGANIGTARACAISESELSVIEIDAEVSHTDRERLVRKISRLVDVIAIRACEAGEEVSVEFSPALCFNASDRKET